MRWLTRAALLGVAVAWAQLNDSAHAACTGGPGNGVPNANALTLFVTSDITTGDINQFGGAYPNEDPAIPGGPGAVIGVTAADAICTYFATSPGPQNPLYSVRIPGHESQPYFNQNNQAGTVQFMSLLSTSTADAIDRVTDRGLGALNVVNGVRDYDIQGYCLASSIADLFFGSDGTGYPISTSMITNENGANPPGGSQVWTGTGLFGPAAVNGQATAAKHGGRYQPPGQPLDNTKGFCRGFDGVRTDDWQVQSGSGAAGTLQSASTDDKKNVWLNDVNGLLGLGTQSCSLGLRLYCLSGQPFDPAPLPTTPPPTTQAGGQGDPQFTGLQGQSFQVHGMPDEFFNLITTPAFQLNSRFTYLASGTCNYNNTECWTHPGTYVDQLGFMFPGIQIKTVAGPHHKGLRAWVNGEEVSAHTKFRLTTITNQTDNSTAIITVRHPHHDTIIVESPLFTVEVTNSDWFFNFNLMFHVPEILSAGRYMHYISDSRPNMGAVDKRYPAYPMHGLVGQTWKNARYPAKRYYQGEVDDYMMLDHALFSKQFLFNLYQY